MTNNNKTSLQLKKLYMNAGKSVMEQSYQHFKKYINYSTADKMITYIKQHKYAQQICLCDKTGAFFDYLCQRLCNEVYNEELVFVTISPYFNTDLACQLFIPFHGCLFTNNMAEPMCKADNLYSNKTFEHAQYYYNIASEFFIKS